MLFTDTPSAALVAALVLGGTTVDATFRMTSRPLAYTRLDPIMSPKKVAGHIHDIRGASRFRDILDPPEVMLESKCTTVDRGDDMSNYWAPMLYWQHANGTLSLMRADTLIYYGANTPVNAFPQGLRMLTGLATKRDTEALQSQGIEWHVNPQDGAHPPPANWNKKYMPNGTNTDEAPYVISANAYFPSCGDGRLDSDDHFSHMTWPVGHGGGIQWMQIIASNQCPDSHPYKYPEIHHETFWHLSEQQRQEWRKGEVNVVLANGDTTGMTYHADFVASWNHEVLQSALKDPTCLNENPDDCPILNAKKSDINACRMEGQIVSEDVGAYQPIDKLPGCNPIWDWNGPDEKPACTEDNPPGFTSANLMPNLGYDFCPPYVIPGLQVGNGSDINSLLGGCPSSQTCVVWDSWPGKGNVSWAQVGTQADVDTNTKQNGNNNRVKIPGLQNDTPYAATEGGVPSENVGLNVMTMTTQITYNCQPQSNAAFGGTCSPQAGMSTKAPGPLPTNGTGSGAAPASPTNQTAGTSEATVSSGAGSASQTPSPGSDAPSPTAGLASESSSSGSVTPMAGLVALGADMPTGTANGTEYAPSATGTTAKGGKKKCSGKRRRSRKARHH